MYPGSYYSHTNPMPYFYAPNDNDPKLKGPQSHMKMDPIPLISPYQPWPYAPNYYYPAPLDYHGCCNHTYFGSGGGPYGFQPPYPNCQLPPPPVLNGFYPFPGAYSIPTPHYSVEQPKYDYDKNNHSPYHCCGCKHQEHEKKPNIEQEEQQLDKKTRESSVPYFLEDCPYPVMWVPPGYMNTESKATEKDAYSHEPVSLKTPEPTKRVETREIDRDQQSGDSGDGDCFPFPLFWLPSNKNEVGDNMKEKNIVNGSTDEKSEQPRKNNETESEFETSGKHVVKKVIPVKQVGPDEENKKPKRIETKAKSDSVENIECKSSSKSSKLPPVCLRIDPLPKKKKTSRSPSPSRQNERSKGSSVNDLKSSEELKNNSENQMKDNIKTVEVINATNEIEKDSRRNHGDNVSITKGDEICEVKKRINLSEREAALIVQSVYRGFKVRKSQPLMKLTQIYEVKKHVVELRNRIQDLESSSTVRVDDKQKLVIGESIMSLLLKLDTIQGLHPIVRDVRKSVANELVGLQEKLDSLTFVKPEAPIEESDSVICENHEIEVTDYRGYDGAQACDINSEPDSCDNHAIEAMGSRDNVNVEERDRDDITVDAKTELSKEDATKTIQEEFFVVSTEDAPKEDDVSSTEMLIDDLERVPYDVSLTSSADKRLMEENEKMKVAMKELMKAGNEQLNVIKELTGRVKDLEKKLSRKTKKIKVNNKKCRARGRCVIQEDPMDWIL